MRELSSILSIASSTQNDMHQFQLHAQNAQIIDMFIFK